MSYSPGIGWISVGTYRNDGHRTVDVVCMTLYGHRTVEIIRRTLCVGRSAPLVGLSMGPFTNWMYPVPQPVVSPWACPLPPPQKYPILFVSPSLDWLAWLGLASLALAWLVSTAAATTTTTSPEQALRIWILIKTLTARPGLDHKPRPRL